MPKATSKTNEQDAQMEFISDNYHAYFISTMRSVESNLHACIRVDEDCVINLPQVHDYFSAFRELLEQHIGECSYIIFPIIKKMGTKDAAATDMYLFGKTLHHFLVEHTELRNLILQLDIMTDHFDCPVPCSPTLKACYAEMKNIKLQYLDYAEAETNYLQPVLEEINATK